MTTPNSHVSRTVAIKVGASSLAVQLDRVALDSPSEPVKALFTDAGMSVWTHDLAKTMHVFLTNAPLEKFKVKEPCVLLINPREFADLLRLKFGDSQVSITTKANEVITLKDKENNRASYYPADEDDCAIVPDRWEMPQSASKKGWRVIPQHGHELCSMRVHIQREYLTRGVVDMEVAKAPYCEFHFSPSGGGTVTSGHWGSKTNQSHSPIQCRVEVSDPTYTHGVVALTNTLTQVLNRSIGDDFILHKHKDTPFVIIEVGDMVCVVAETTKGV